MDAQLDLLPLACCPAPQRSDNAEWEPRFDFKTDGPPKPRCHLCSVRFKDWAVADEDWRKISAIYWPCQLCKHDYRRLLRDAGHDPKAVPISDEPWERRVALWEPTKDMPADHVHVLLNKRRGRDRELREAKVVRKIDAIVHVVQVFKNTPGKRPRGKGTAYLATWDRMLYANASGRPIMVALGKVPRQSAKDSDAFSTKWMTTVINSLPPATAGAEAKG